MKQFFKPKQRIVDTPAARDADPDGTGVRTNGGGLRSGRS
jgi:hypothetical protein